MSAEQEIRRTLALYPKYVDDRDSDGFASLFAEDGKIHSSSGEFVGPSEIKQFLEDLYATRPPDRQFKHIWSNSVITINGDTAESVSDILVFECFAGHPWFMNIVARHRDKLARQTDGRWLFTEKAGEGGRFAFMTYAPKDSPHPTFGIREE
jgi:SnoaL-like domain